MYALKKTMREFYETRTSEVKAAGKAVVVGVGIAANGAYATGLDVTAITAALTDIATVGTAVFGVYVAIKLIKWLRRAL